VNAMTKPLSLGQQATDILIRRTLKSRGMETVSYEAVPHLRQTWRCETSRGERWVWCRDGKWGTSKEEPKG
jgi:hypothetical protein